MFDYSEFYERQIEFYKGFIEYDEHDIRRLNREIKESRKQDREIVEYVWSKGPLDKWHHEVFTEGYVSCSTRDLINERARAYRRKKKDERYLKYYEQELAKYEGR